ncbi:MAG: hypothetical protein V7K21_16610 [Nostoc sp.]|uniref:hypothetical protein n=1 Tax=Nostoc sp. TaxID=1180 RepID=UPI002FF9FF6E
MNRYLERKKGEIMEYCFVEFQVDDFTRFNALCEVFNEIKKDKDNNYWRNEEDWLIFFDRKALSNFWWPSEEEKTEHYRRWFATPVEQRWTDPSLKTPWDFESMFDAFENGEYQLISCSMVSADRARLEFEPFSYPYGGIGAIQALVESFDFVILAEDDGTGYTKFNL